MEGWRTKLKRALDGLKFSSFGSGKKKNDSPSVKQPAFFKQELPSATPVPPDLPKPTLPKAAASPAAGSDKPAKQPDAQLASRPSGLPTGPGASNARPQVPAKTAAKRIEPAFPAPDMSRLTIRYKGAKSAASQTWQAVGRQLTLYSSQKKGAAVCTIGLDFGTAFTKACFQFRAGLYVADWRLAVPECTPPLLPSVLSVKPDGSCVLGDSDGTAISGLKLALLQTRDAASQVNAVAFLALVLRYIRAQCFTEYQTAFSGFAIEWFLNIGLPTEPWQDRDTSELYERLALAAWNLSTSAFTVSLTSARNALESIETGRVERDLLFRPRIKSFPEFVGQIASYVHSAQRRPDLHLLVDIGAGTVDIALFHIGRDEMQDNAFLIHKSSIERLGTHILLGYRVETSHSLETIWDEEFAGLTGSAFEAKAKLRAGCLREVDTDVSEKLFLKMRWLVSQTKQYRYQSSPVWKDGLPFLLCGGGRDMDVYRGALHQVNSQWKLQDLQLKPPPSLAARSVGVANFHRVSVAHGLSFTADNLGQIVPEKDVPDIRYRHPSRPGYSENYIEK